MDKKSKIFFIALTFLLFTSIGVTYYRYVVLGDYTIFTDENTIPSVFDILKFNTK
ncbi:MAG: hypothetical protein AAB484_00040 [Patescibacteria group bacterium]